MNQPSRETEEAKGANVYSSTPTSDAPAGTPGTSSVRVYDRPDTPKSGVSMVTIVLMIIALLAVGAIVWSVMM
jgi:hypothetical protein